MNMIYNNTTKLDTVKLNEDSEKNQNRLTIVQY